MAGSRLAQLAESVARLTGGDGIHATAVPGLELFRASAPSAPLVAVYEPCLCLVAQGSKEVLLAGEVYRYDPAQFLLVAVDLPVTGQVTEASREVPYLAVKVALDPAAVGELATPTPDAPPGRGLAASPVEPELLDAVARLVALVDAPRDIAALAPLLHREVTYRLLTGPQGARLRQVTAGDGRARRVARAVRWLREHYAEPLRLPELAREARMSPSALFEHFKAVTALSPLQYQKRLRLQEARRLLLGGGVDAAGAGFRVGYESPSQFSREYRRLFGAPPRQDATAQRAAQGSAGPT